MNAPVTNTGRPRKRPAGANYKFQRLREKIRRAVEAGDLSGKLPGERALARRFHVNAKTLSKALTDLAAEGVLDRSIGRGTYVKGSAPAAVARGGRWLVLCPPGDQPACALSHLRELCPTLEVATSIEQMRPSFLNQFTAVLNLDSSIPDSFLRDLLVRNMQVVAINHEPGVYSMHAVLPDVALGASRLCRDLMLAGHRRLAALEPRGRTVVAQALRHAAPRYAPGATIDSADASEAPALVDHGVTALVCGSTGDARSARAALAAQGIDVPGQVSLTAVACMCPEAACSGYFVECRQIAESAISLLRDARTRPVTLWLCGSWVDRSTIAPTGAALPLDETAPLRVSGVVV